MAVKPRLASKRPANYHGVKLPLRVIRSYARRLAERFQPDKIILFGSRAYGTPHEDSEVDLLVIMSCRNEIDQAVKIHWELPAPFPVDLLVRKLSEWEWRTREVESVSTVILNQGKDFYAKGNS